MKIFKVVQNEGGGFLVVEVTPEGETPVSIEFPQEDEAQELADQFSATENAASDDTAE